MSNQFPSAVSPSALRGLTQVVMFTDPQANKVAAVTDLNGAPLPGGKVPVSADGVLADFLHATATVLYFRGSSGAVFKVYPEAHASVPTVTGSRGANAALQSLLTALASQGIIVDSSS